MNNHTIGEMTSIGHFSRRKFIKENYIRLFNKKDKILDLGCGSGDYTNYFHLKGHQIIGVDINDKAIKFAKKNYPKCKFLLNKDLNLKFKENSFDCVLGFGIFDYTTIDEQKKILTEVQRVLKPSGKFYTMMLSNKSILHILNYRILRPNPNYQRRYDSNTEIKLYSKIGFKKLKKINIYYYSSKHKFLNLILKIFYRLNIELLCHVFFIKGYKDE